MQLFACAPLRVYCIIYLCFLSFRVSFQAHIAVNVGRFPPYVLPCPVARARAPRSQEVYVTNSHLYMAMDLIEGGNLAGRCRFKGEKEAAVVVRQIVRALRYLHDRNIAVSPASVRCFARMPEVLLCLCCCLRLCADRSLRRYMPALARTAPGCGYSFARFRSARLRLMADTRRYLGAGYVIFLHALPATVCLL